MTVLGGDRARGLGVGGARKYVVGVAVAIVGVAAAFGLSRLIDEEQSAVYTGPLVERSMAMEESVDALREGARAQIGSVTASSRWTLEQELTQIHAGSVMSLAEWTLERELAQIHAGNVRSVLEGTPASQPGGPS